MTTMTTISCHDQLRAIRHSDRLEDEDCKRTLGYDHLKPNMKSQSLTKNRISCDIFHDSNKEAQRE